jgi:citrate synthase
MSETRITVRGRDLANDLIGKVTFTEMMLLAISGREPSPSEIRTIDAVLVSLMDHGLTPSAISTRLALEGAPDSLQGALAAGLLAVGSRFLGVIEEAAGLLQLVVADGCDAGAAARHVARLREEGHRIPGLGHNILQSHDPRVEAILAVATAEGVAGEHVRALGLLQQAASDATDRPLVVNATGAVGAVLSHLGYSADVVRGFALVARSAGLFAHAIDERTSPIARELWMHARAIRTTE